MAADAALVDTNVIVYALDPDSAFHPSSRRLLESAREVDAGLTVTAQVIGEFYAIVTDRRRVSKARTSIEALDAIDQVLALPGMTLLPHPIDFVARWTQFARQYPLPGQSIYDLQLVATMLAYDVSVIYTYNRIDFDRYEQIRVLTPPID